MSKKYKEATALIEAVLLAHFPNCFIQKGQPKRPLKIGIFADILTFFPQIEPKHLSAFLCRYTSHPSYQLMIRKGEARVGLDGIICGYVLDKEETHAEKRLQKFNPKSVHGWKTWRIPKPQDAEVVSQ